MLKKSLFLLLIFFTCQLAIAQISEQRLLGTWELLKRESELEDVGSFTENENDSVPKKREVKGDIILQFKENNVLNYTQWGTPYRITFSLKDSLLTLGQRQYVIVKLSDAELILKDPDDFSNTTEHYQKTSQDIEIVPEYEDVEEYYPNGQLKFKGQKHNGFQNGKWEEWHENGQLKSVQFFLDGIPYGVWRDYDQNGKLIKTKKW
jgi:hypothetical protein